MILVNGQWQGGGDPETYDGAAEIERLYLSGIECRHAGVSPDRNLAVEDLIIGNGILKKQIRATMGMLEAEAPPKLFTVGGGCDADVASLSYMNRRYHGDLTVLWFDAHGDINAPEESESHLFFGMPLRMLLGDPHYADLIDAPLQAEQVINIGGRDLDDSEIRYMRKHHIPVIAADQVEKVIPEILSKQHGHVYIHLDLDCLEPGDFSSTPLPVASGIRAAQLLDLLQAIRQRFAVAGMGLYEYKPCGTRNSMIEELVRFGETL